MTIVKSLKRTPTLSFLLRRKKTEKTVICPLNESFGMQQARENAKNFHSERNSQLFFPECVAAHTRNTKRGNHASSGKNLDVQNRCVHAVERTVARIERPKSTIQQ